MGTERSIRARAPALIACALLPTALATGSTPSYPLSWFEPLVPQVASMERDLRQGRIVTEDLAADASEVMVFAAGLVDTTAGAFVEAYRNPQRLWEGPAVPSAGLLSLPPRLEDFSRVTLDSRDLDALRHCEPGDCDVKLSAAEIERIRRAVDSAGTNWRPAGLQAFREVLLERARTYLERGMSAIEPYADGGDGPSPAAIDHHLRRRLLPLLARVPGLSEYLSGPAVEAPPGLQWRLVWIQTHRTPKPTLQLLHVIVVGPRPASSAPEPDALVVWRLVYASHYVNGWMSIGALIEDGRGAGFLGYLHRAHIDGLGGWLGGLRRHFIKRRLRGAAEAGLAGQRDRLARE